MTKPYTLFLTKRADKTIPFGAAHHLCSPNKGVYCPPGLKHHRGRDILSLPEALRVLLNDLELQIDR